MCYQWPIKTNFVHACEVIPVQTITNPKTLQYKVRPVFLWVVSILNNVLLTQQGKNATHLETERCSSYYPYKSSDFGRKPNLQCDDPSFYNIIYMKPLYNGPFNNITISNLLKFEIEDKKITIDSLTIFQRICTIKQSDL